MGRVRGVPHLLRGRFDMVKPRLFWLGLFRFVLWVRVGRCGRGVRRVGLVWGGV